MEAVLEGNSLAVGLGEIKTSRQAQDQLVAYGLGSCVAVGAYDPVTRVAGLLHAVLPEGFNDVDSRSPKYVDTGIATLFTELDRLGAVRGRLVVRVVGGANMLTAPGFKNSLNIGERNVRAARATLAALKMRVTAEDVGGNAGRTVRLFVADGRMTVRVIGSEARSL